MTGDLELKPCPFCGVRLERSEVFSSRTRDHYFHPKGDERCPAQNVLVHKPESVARWNRRAALSREGEARVQVKPLVWEPWENQRHGYNNRLIAARAETPFNAYFLEHDDGSGRWWVTDRIMGPEIAGPFGDEQEARAAAQADYKARILSAINTSPVPDITDEAVERAGETE